MAAGAFRQLARGADLRPGPATGSRCRVGGIGTGTVGFGGRGQFRDWELENHPSKGLTVAAHASWPAGCPARAWRRPGPDPRGRAVRRGGRGLDRGLRRRWPGCPGSPSASSRPRTRSAGCCCPTRDFPVAGSASRRSTRWSPATPRSAACRWPCSGSRSTSRASEPLDGSVMFSVEALTGHAAARRGQPSRPAAEPRSAAGPDRRPARPTQAMDTGHEEWGTIARRRARRRTPGPGRPGAWASGTRACSRCGEGFARDRPARGRACSAGTARRRDSAPRRSPARSGARRALEPGGQRRGHVPARLALPQPPVLAAGRHAGPRGVAGPEIVGNYYTTGYADAWDVLAAQAPRLAELRAATAAVRLRVLVQRPEPARSRRRRCST